MSDKLKKYAEDNRILEITSGSHLYGTTTPESDEDFMGIFMPPAEYVLGLNSVKEVDLGIVSKLESGKNSKDAVDRKLYEFRKFCQLAMANNPNIIEMLFVDDKNIKFINPIGKRLLDMKHLFPSKVSAKKFIGYAHSQRHKMIVKRDHFNELTEGYKILSDLEDKLTMGQAYDRHQFSSAYQVSILVKKQQGAHIHIGDICFEPGIYVKKARKKLKERLDKVTNRSELVLNMGYDVKFGGHLIRLLTEGITLLETGALTFPLHNAQELLDIRNGSWTIEELLEYSEDLESQLDRLLANSSLPATADYNKIEQFVIEEMRCHLHRETAK
jgi:hypothetical protein